MQMDREYFKVFCKLTDSQYKLHKSHGNLHPILRLFADLYQLASSNWRHCFSEPTLHIRNVCWLRWCKHSVLYVSPQKSHGVRTEFVFCTEWHNAFSCVNAIFTTPASLLGRKSLVRLTVYWYMWQHCEMNEYCRHTTSIWKSIQRYHSYGEKRLSTEFLCWKQQHL
jgi:hypothetical protein